MLQTLGLPGRATTGPSSGAACRGDHVLAVLLLRSSRPPLRLHAIREKCVIQRSPAVDHLARRLLEHEAGGVGDVESLAAAVEGACRKLSDELETLVGRGGVAALLGRAVSLAKREFPYLAAVRLQADRPLSFVALRESLQGRTPGEAKAASTALLANLLGLLANLLGEDMGLRPVMSVWPNLLPEPGSPTVVETEG